MLSSKVNKDKVRDKVIPISSKSISNRIKKSQKKNKSQKNKLHAGKPQVAIAKHKTQTISKLKFVSSKNLVDEISDEIILQKVKSIIKTARESLDNFDLQGARTKYLEIIKIYNDLSEKQKANVYVDIRNFYYERKSSEQK